MVDGGLTWDLNVLSIGTARSSLETEGSKRCQKEPGEFVGNHYGNWKVPTLNR